MKSYTGTITTGIVLTNPTTQNPATLAAGGYVTNTKPVYLGDAVYGTIAAAWNFTNLGRINATRSLSSGVDFRAGGTVTNGAGDLIAGAASGVQIDGSAGTVTNSGTISGTGSYRFGYGVYLAAGGSVTNTSSGRILGAATAVEINSSPGAVTNSGTISSTGADGVYLAAGGTVINAASAQISGTFDGVVIGGNTGTITNSVSAKITGGNAGVVMTGDYDTVNNYGTITGGTGVYLYASNGTVINNAGGVIGGVVTGVTIGSTLGLVVNAGIISASGTSGIGVLVSSNGGGVGNVAGGKITGVRAGVEIDGNAGVVTNYGSISATGVAGLGVALYAGGGEVQNQTGGSIVGSLAGVKVSALLSTVSNAGTISATAASGIGVYLPSDGGYVTNYAGGSIAGVFNGIEIDSGSATVVNSGRISATETVFYRGSGDGIFLSTGGGVITNKSGGTITGPNNGVEVDSAVGTVSNSGSITGTGTAGFGIYIYTAAGGGGEVTNTSSGVIFGVRDGINIGSTGGTGSGTVVNSGRIIATETVFYRGAGDGIFLATGGGVITNNFGGTITGPNNGVEVDSAVGTVSNSGSITGTGTAGYGVYIYTGAGGGGHVTNTSSGVIVGVRDGINIGSTAGTGSGTVVNSGTISATSNIVSFGFGDGVFLSTGGGVVTNNLGGTISGLHNGVEIYSALGTVSNYGSITGTGTAGYGIYLHGGGGFVTNKAGGTIRGVRRGVDVDSLTGAVTNSGTIIATATTGTGVYLRAGSVTNLGMVIAGTNGTGIYVYSGNVTNSGTIIAAGSSAKAAYVRYGTFFNSGLVEGAVSGVELSLATGTAGSGRVTVSGTVVGATGISVAPTVTAGQTVTVSGTVTGTSGTAVSLGGLTGRLIVDPGAAFTGIVDGGGGSSVLEISASGSGSSALGAGAAAGVGAANTAAYIALGSAVNFTSLQIDNSATLDGSGVLSFGTLVNQGAINVASGDSLAFGTVASAASTGTIDLRAGGTVTFSGSVANQNVYFHPPGGTAVIAEAGVFHGMVTGFTGVGDAVDLTGLVFTGNTNVGFNSSTDMLTITEGTGSAMLQLGSGSYSGISWVARSDGVAGTDVTLSPPSPPPPSPPPPPVNPCYRRGTLILTERGEVAVEELAVGDRVKTLSGALKAIVWIGVGRDLVTRKNRLARPVIVRRGALADDVPRRDLYLTHGHALYLGGVLIPVEHLVNHRSILWDEAARVVEYYHIELAEHDVVFAEGAPAETYHDAGNRAVFQNAREGSAAGITQPTFAPVLQEGEIVETAWAALFARAGGQVETATTDDPDVHLLVDGVRLDPVTADDGVYSFAVQRPPAAALLLCSRSAVPSLLGLGRSDHRRLGVPIGRITLWQAGIATSFDHDAPQLREGGCHPAEDGYCWTDGELALPARFFALLNSTFTLVVHTRRHCLPYPITAPLAEAA